MPNHTRCHFFAIATALAIASCNTSDKEHQPDQTSTSSAFDSESFNTSAEIDNLLSTLSKKTDQLTVLASKAALGDNASFKNAVELSTEIDLAIKNLLAVDSKTLITEQISAIDELQKKFGAIVISDPKDLERAKKMGHSTGENLDLCTRIGDQYKYFTEKEWESMSPSIQAKYQKLGIVIKRKDQHYLLSLYVEPENYTWDQAYSKYGTRLPDMEKASVLGDMNNDLQHALATFGGDQSPYKTWTRTDIGGYGGGVMVIEPGCVIYSISESKSFELPVRTISPMP